MLLRNQILQGDIRAIAPTLPSESVQCIVTSPPYWNLRNYGVEGQLGGEATPEEYVVHIVEVFHALWRVLREDGVCWLNLGDTYAANRGYQYPSTKGGPKHSPAQGFEDSAMHVPLGLKAKDLVGIPWRCAFALQADGWYLRSDIIWGKPAPMPESVRDRCTRSHEYIFMLTKSPRYFYDSEAIAEPLARPDEGDRATPAKFGGADKYIETSQQSRLHSGNEYTGTTNGKRNKRDVWIVSSQPFSGPHPAVFPPELIRPCILAGTSEKGCCPECGKPWVRVVEKSRTYESGSGKAGNKPEGKGTQDNQCDGALEDDIRAGPCVQSKTIGWQPQCTCDQEPIPCLVLDPFMGSGTTAQVAIETGRDWLGVELKADYIKLAERRIREAAGQSVLPIGDLA